MQVFEDRRDAGRQLGVVLRQRGDLAPERTVVLAIPRGGLPVGAEVALALGSQFDIAVVRKLRAPHNPELGFGAVGPNGQVIVDDELVARIGMSTEQVEAEIADRRSVVQERLAVYRAKVPGVDLGGKTAVVVDDGVATGGTARQACALAKRSGAERVILATPVAPQSVETRVSDVADDVVVLSQPQEFIAVGQAYRDFSQLDDAAALAIIDEVFGRRAV
jgi:putative phosphoribosyl transferase